MFLLERCMITCPIKHNNPAVLEMFLLSLFEKKGLFTLKLKKINKEMKMMA